MVWFRLNIGRERNADPRWLLPLICRAGDVTKAEIGSIKIFDRDTRFQIAAEFAEQFETAVRTNDSKEGHISRVREGDGPVPSYARPARPPRSRDGMASPVAPPRDDAADAGPSAERPPFAGKKPHRKGKPPPQSRNFAPGFAPRANAAPGGPGGPSKSKYAHKKKHRADEPAKS